MKTVAIALVLLCSLACVAGNKACKFSETTVSGTEAPSKFCSGDLIFSDTFETFDLKRWTHENTLGGGGNWEFQWYTNNRTNSFVRDGSLYIKPSLTSEQFGENFLTSGTLDINGGFPASFCTNPAYWGCSRTGNSVNIVNPVKSAKVTTSESFSFRYGRLEIEAKLPTGDWLWPAIWLLPRTNSYGEWVASGEIDLMESRGNKELVLDGLNIGNKLSTSTLHWGPDSSQNRYRKTHWEKTNENGFDKKFHKYQLIWTTAYIQFLIDDKEIGKVTPPAGGFWEMGAFDEAYYNPWVGRSKIAPFDQEFFILINLAVGGISYFPDAAMNPAKKPWENDSKKAATDFWNGRSDWLPTWNLDTGDDAALQIRSVKVYAL